MEMTMEDVVACLGFTEDSPLATGAPNFPKIADLMAVLAEKQNPDAITPPQKQAAEQLMGIMRGHGPLAEAEAAAQLLAMVAADDSRNPHLMHVDTWISTACTVLQRCHDWHPAPSQPQSPSSASVQGDRQEQQQQPPWCSEALVVCAASCLADLMNNPRSTIVCSTRAHDIFSALQGVLLLPCVRNRMLYFQACRGIAEVLHPSTWPMNEPARVPRPFLDMLLKLLSTPASATVAEAGTSAVDAAAAGAAVAEGGAVPNGVEMESSRPGPVEAKVSAVGLSVAAEAGVGAGAGAGEGIETGSSTSSHVDGVGSGLAGLSLRDGAATGRLEAAAAPTEEANGAGAAGAHGLAGAAAASLQEARCNGAVVSAAVVGEEGNRGRHGGVFDARDHVDEDHDGEEEVVVVEEEEEMVIMQDDLIHTQASKVIQFMATSGAAPMLLANTNGLVPALEALRQSSRVDEVVLQADAAIMSLWLSPDGFHATNTQMRPVIAENLLRALGSEELVDNHQDCSLALVTSTMNPERRVRAQAISLHTRLLEQHPELVHIVVGHVEDTDSLAHQSMVYFVLHLLESEAAIDALTAAPRDVQRLVHALVASAVAERHGAPVVALTRLLYHHSARSEARLHLTKSQLHKLRAVPGGRVQREVENLIKALTASDEEICLVRTNSEKDVESQVSGTYLGDPSLQSLFFRQIARSKTGKLPAMWKRAKSTNDIAALAHQAEGSGDSWSSFVV